MKFQVCMIKSVQSYTSNNHSFVAFGIVRLQQTSCKPRKPNTEFVALLPGHSHLQSLIACSMQIQIKDWRWNSLGMRLTLYTVGLLHNYVPTAVLVAQDPTNPTADSLPVSYWNRSTLGLGLVWVWGL